jgi:hypothetical protein
LGGYERIKKETQEKQNKLKEGSRKEFKSE